MPRILLLGATGYLGLPLALSLRRSSHTVYGVSRSPSKSTLLASNEVIPITGSATDTAAWLPLIAAAHIDVVVDASGANDSSAAILAAVQKAAADRLAAYKAHGVSGPKLAFVYTSGMWVHGASPEPVTDSFPVGTADMGAPTAPVPMVAWRPALEQQILAARDVLDVAIVRPSMMYGRTNPFWGLLFGPLVAAASAPTPPATVNVPADPAAKIGLVHVDDAVSALHLAIEKVSIVGGPGGYPVFDVVSSFESLREIVEAAAKVLGFEGGVECVGAGGDYAAEALSAGIRGDSGRARALLGWVPGRGGMAAGVEVYVGAWKAGNVK